MHPIFNIYNHHWYHCHQIALKNRASGAQRCTIRWHVGIPEILIARHQEMPTVSASLVKGPGVAHTSCPKGVSCEFCFTTLTMA